MASGSAAAEKTDEQRAFRKLMSDLASELQQNEVQSLGYILHGCETQGGFSSALSIFSQLERKGSLGPRNIGLLKDTLRDIHRSDLISKLVEPFENQSSTHSVPIDVSNPAESAVAALSTPSQESSSNASQSLLSGLGFPMSMTPQTSTPRSNLKPPTIQEESSGSQPPSDITSSSECKSTTTGFQNPQIHPTDQKRAHTNLNTVAMKPSSLKRRRKRPVAKSLSADQSSALTRPRTAPVITPGGGSNWSVSESNHHASKLIFQRQTFPVARYARPKNYRACPPEAESCFTHSVTSSSSEGSPSGRDEKRPFAGVEQLRGNVQDCSPSTPRLHPPRTQPIAIPPANYSKSLLWKLKADKLISKIREKDSSPLKNKFTLPVGCCYGNGVNVDLALCSYESRGNRSISLYATLTIPTKCSQRRHFVHFFESKYRLLVDVASEGMLIADSCCVERELASMDRNEIHETQMNVEKLFEHVQTLDYRTIDLTVTVQLVVLKEREPLPRVSEKEEHDFICFDKVDENEAKDTSD